LHQPEGEKRSQESKSVFGIPEGTAVVEERSSNSGIVDGSKEVARWEVRTAHAEDQRRRRRKALIISQHKDEKG